MDKSKKGHSHSLYNIKRLVYLNMNKHYANLSLMSILVFFKSLDQGYRVNQNVVNKL